MDKNIIAFIRDDTKTIGVRFFNDVKPEDIGSMRVNYDTQTILGKDLRYTNVSKKEYTYLTYINDIQVGDFVVVLVGDIPKVVLVTTVHEELAIEPNDTTQYKWVICKVDMKAFNQEMAKNKELSTVLAESYRLNLKQQFRSTVLGGMGQDAQLRIANILGTKNVTE